MPHKAGNVVVLLHIERQNEARLILMLVGQRRDSPPIALPLIVGLVGQMIEAADAALLHDDLSNGPSDRAIVGDAEDQALFPVEHSHRDASWLARKL